MNTSLHFIVADDHPAFRKGMVAFLSEHFTSCTVDEADNGEAVLQALDNSQYDIIFLDIKMPELNGIETTKRIVARNPDAKVIALSFYEDETSILTMFESGAKAYLNKDANSSEIMNAVENVLHDSIYISNKNVHEALRKQLSGNYTKNRALSEREKEILILICKGFSTKEIADQLYLSAKTVENHRNHLLEKTGTNNTASLVMYAAKKGLV